MSTALHILQGIGALVATLMFFAAIWLATPDYRDDP